MFRRVSRCARGSGLGWRVCPTRGDSARTGRILGRHKNGEYAAVTHGRPAFQRHEAHAEGSDTTPMQKCRKNAKREFLSPPPTGLPADSSSARTTASIAFVWSAAKPLPCQMHRAGRSPAPRFLGRSPHPLKDPPNSPRGREKSFQKGH